MSGPKDMQFQHTYVKKEKIDAAQKNGVFSSQFKSYIADGTAGLQEREGVRRAEVMRDVRQNLRDQMRMANQESMAKAADMQARHRELRIKMQESLLRAKEATRQKRLLDAKLLAAKSKQSTRNAEASEAKLNDMVEEDRLAANAAYIGLQAEDDSISEEDVAHRIEDIAAISQLRDEASDNKETVHHKNLFSLFRAISKKSERDAIESEIDRQKEIIDTEKNALRVKAESWNNIRKRYETDSFRKYYTMFDNAAIRYRAVNRKGSDRSFVPPKAVMEYVGEFDLERLNSTLDSLQQNPYLKVNVDFRNKKENRGNSDEELMKTHSKITVMGEADETGYRRRFKLNDDGFGYAAKRQFSKDDPTALTDTNQAKILISAERMKLEIDEKDARGQFINSEENLEIIQAKQDKWFGAKTVNGIFLDGEFISTNYSLIKGKKDASTIGAFNRWSKYKKKEEVRKAVLKATIFNQINSKTIQYAMGYGASSNLSDVNDSLVNEMTDKILGEQGLPEWGVKVDATDAMNEAVANGKDPKEAEKNAQKKVVRDRLFSKEHDQKLLKGDNKDVLPDPVEAKWEQTMRGGDADAKKALPRSVKIKVAYDVIRQEFAKNKGAAHDLTDKHSRVGSVLNAIVEDHKALSDVALLLLGVDNNPEYWNMAKTITTKLLLTSFEKKFQGTFDSRFARALAKAGSGEGQLMRMALIDELNANRSHWDPNDMLNALMPTRWKQFKEDIAGKRGTWATVQQKLTDGSILQFANDVFTSFVDITDGMKSFSPDTLRSLGIANTYSTALTSAINLGAIAEAGAYAISDLGIGDETYEETVKNKDGSVKLNEDGTEVKETKHKNDDHRNAIGLAFTMAQNAIKLIKIGNKFWKKRTKEIEEKKKAQPNYNPVNDLAFVDNSYYQLVTSGISTALGVASTVSKFAGAKDLKNILSAIKNAMSIYEESLNIHMANRKIGVIQDTEKGITAITEKENKTKEDTELLSVLSKNSQLQYGMACAKRKNRDDRAGSIINIISNIGKGAINILKTAWPEGKKNPIFIAVDAVWGVVMTGARTVTDVVRSKLATRANIAKMIGKQFKGVNRGILNEVLRREAGIESADYLTDLARIFMSLDTYQFMQEAGETGTEEQKRAEKIIGAKIAQTLYNNPNYNENTLKKVKADKLMGIMGVKGNFRKILKHSLAT
ncbi:MAG: hypothetical protein J5509_04930 [Lachnospiraceae bacterium]|nr:hypothetical protein [Lachnospiraceae bacterium]